MFAWCGTILSETGQKLDSIGHHWRGITKENGVLHRRVVNFGRKSPIIGQGCWIAPSASVIGAVEMGKNSFVWYGAIIRADVHHVRIGSNTNIGDRVVIHEASEKEHTDAIPTLIGDNVIVDPNSVLHACTIQDQVRIGSGSVILDGSIMEKSTMLESGSLLTKGKVVPSGEVWGGNPAKFVRKITEEDIKAIKKMAEQWTLYGRRHQLEDQKTEDEFLETQQRLTQPEELGVIHREQVP